MAKTFNLKLSDLADLIALIPSPPGMRRRSGFSYDGTTLTVKDDAEAAKVASIINDRQWLSRAKVAKLKGYAANARFNREVAGIVVDGISVGTTREDQARIVAAQLMAAANPQLTFHWKKPDGSFARLTSEQVVSIGEKVSAYVQACFAVEDTVGTTIAQPTSMTEAQIDAAFATVKV
jgi:hypothetical protein